MFARPLALVLLALVCAFAARPCAAMLVTPGAPEDVQRAIDQAVYRRNAAEVDAHEFSRISAKTAKERQSTQNIAKAAVAHPAPETLNRNPVREATSWSVYAALAAMLAAPLAVILLLRHLTRRALQCRESERRAMLPPQIVDPYTEPQPTETPKPTFDSDKLKEIWMRTLSKVQNDPPKNYDPPARIPTPA